MKFNLHINQMQAIEIGIKNVQEALIFDFLSNRSFGDEVIVENTVWYFISRTKIVTELPILNLKKDTVYRYFKSLEKAGLIFYKTDKKRDLIRISAKGKKYYSDSVDYTMSEKNPSYYVGKKSENEKKLGKKSEKKSEKNPTYNTTMNIIEEEEEEIYLEFAKWIPLRNKIQNLEVLAKSLKNNIENGDKKTVENFELFKKSLLKNDNKNTQDSNIISINRLNYIKNMYNIYSANDLSRMDELSQYPSCLDAVAINYIKSNGGLRAIQYRVMDDNNEAYLISQLVGAA